MVRQMHQFKTLPLTGCLISSKWPVSQEYVYTFTQVTLYLMLHIQRLVPEVCDDSNTCHEGGGSYGLASIHWPYQQIRQVNK